MNGINVGTSKVSIGYKGSQNTDYIILGQTIVNTNNIQHGIVIKKNIQRG